MVQSMATSAPNKSIAVCRLCQEKKPLVKSHIIPEFLFKPLYRSGHRFSVLSTSPRHKRRLEQKGFREKLLCFDCDSGIIGPWESYAKGVLSGAVAIDKSHSPQELVFKDVEYNKFKMFQLSLLWRCSITTLPEFSEVSVGKKHEDRLRNWILTSVPGEPHEYGCFLVYPNVDDGLLREVVLPGLITPPIRDKINGHTIYRMFLAQLFWIFHVSSHTETFEGKEYFLSEEGTLRVPIESQYSVTWLKRLILDLKIGDL